METQMPKVPPGVKPRGEARTVVAAKPVELVMVSYYDEYGVGHTQLAVVGDNNVHLLDGKATGFSQTATPHGLGSDWLTKGVFSTLKKKK